MIDIFFEIFQQGQISKVATQAKHASDRSLDSKYTLKDLEQRHEQLKLVTLAMWQMLKAHTGLTDNDLKKFIKEVDLSDGELDNRVDHVESGEKCSSCTHKIPVNSIRCLYCGAANGNHEILSRTGS